MLYRISGDREGVVALWWPLETFGLASLMEMEHPSPGMDTTEVLQDYKCQSESFDSVVAP